MTNTAKRVSDEENREVGGMALCHKSFVDDKQNRIQELRERQAAYLESLPTDQDEANDKALRILCPDSESWPIELTRARHLSVALTALVGHGDFDGDNFERSAATWIAETISYDLDKVRKDIELVTDLIQGKGKLDFGHKFEA